MFPAARKGDPITHDMIVPCGVIGPPISGPCPPPMYPVIIEGLPAAHVTCTVVCSGVVSGGIVHPPLPVPPPIVKGSPTVLIHGMPAARWVMSMDIGACGVFLGDPKLIPTRTVIIGDFGTVVPATPGVALPAAPVAPAPAVAAPAAPAAAGPQKADVQKLDDIKAFLKKSPTGSDAVKYLDEKKIPINFANGGGSYWDGKQIVVDRNESTQDAALTLVHEVHHARSDKEGKGADAGKDSRQDYVKKQVEEEAVGTVKSIQTKNELAVARVDVSGASFPLEKQYNDAHANAAKKFRKDNPKATQAEVDAAAEKEGLVRVRKGFNDGEVVTSNTNEKYPDYYGKGWDKRRKP